MHLIGDSMLIRFATFVLYSTEFDALITIVIEKAYVGRYIAQAFPRVVTAIFTNEVEVLLLLNPKIILVAGKCNLLVVFSSLFPRYLALVDLWCIDYCKSSIYQCYELNYRFRSLVHLNCDLICSVHLNSRTALSIDSASSASPSAGWLEREISDLYGIFFVGNHDMRRILTDYGFIGYPFRRNFPLLGYTEMRYDDEHAELISYPIYSMQSLRFGHKPFSTPWNLKDLSFLIYLIVGFSLDNLYS
jgi:NADH:ubiquinone oxidoreductase subunit C